MHHTICSHDTEIERYQALLCLSQTNKNLVRHSYKLKYVILWHREKWWTLTTIQSIIIYYFNALW
jgi:hypothetical protein